MYRLARLRHRHRYAVALTWLAVPIGLVIVAISAGSAFKDSLTLPKIESGTAIAPLQKNAPATAGSSGTVVWHMSGAAATDAPVERRMTVVLQQSSHAPGVTSVLGPYSAGGAAQISAATRSPPARADP